MSKHMRKAGARAQAAVPCRRGGRLLARSPTAALRPPSQPHTSLRTAGPATWAAGASSSSSAHAAMLPRAKPSYDQPRQ